MLQEYAELSESSCLPKGFKDLVLVDAQISQWNVKIMPVSFVKLKLQFILKHD